MFTKLSIKNLRCFDDFVLDALAPLTLVSGRNNAGKTTLLEGVFLLLNHSDVSAFQAVSGWRGMECHASVNQGISFRLNPSYLWETLFTNIDMERELSISVTDHASVTRRLLMAKDEQFPTSTFLEQSQVQPMLQPAKGSYALRLTLQDGSGQDEIGRLVLTQGGAALSGEVVQHRSMKPVGIYLGPNRYLPQQAVAEWFSKVELRNEKQRLVRSLRHLCEEIEDIFTVWHDGAVGIFSRMRNGVPLPIRAVGDGVNRLFHYLSVMIANPGGVFLFDEIDSGFHHSFYRKAWELVSMVAVETDSQVIATTHSYECIKAAVEGTSQHSPGKLTYVRLGKEGEKIVPYSFSEADLAYALEQEMEVR